MTLATVSSILFRVCLVVLMIWVVGPLTENIVSGLEGSRYYLGWALVFFCLFRGSVRLLEALFEAIGYSYGYLMGRYNMDEIFARIAK